MMDSKHVAAVGHVPRLHTHTDPLPMAPQKWRCTARPPPSTCPQESHPFRKGLPRIRPSQGKRSGKGGCVPRALGTVMVTDTLSHHRGSGSGDPAPAQRRREHVPCAFGKPMIGVTSEGTSPPVPGRGRGKDLHAVPAVGKPQLSSAQPQLILTEPGPRKGRGGGPRAPRIPPTGAWGVGRFFVFFLGK